MNKTECPPFPDNPSRCTVLIELRRSASILSLVGSLLVIFLIWLLRKYKHSVSQRQIFWLCVAGLIQAIAGSLSGATEDGTTLGDSVCVAIGFAAQLGISCIMLRVTCIAFNVAWNVVLYRETTSRQEWAYHVICWGLSLIMASVPLILDAYGNTGGWCWITGKHKALRFIIYYGPLYAVLTWLIITYVFIFRKYAKEAKTWDGSYRPEKEERKFELRRSARTMIIYPIAFILLAIFPFANRVHQAAHGEENALYWLTILHAISSPLLGTANAFAYALDKHTLAALKARGVGRLLRHRINLQRRQRSDSIRTYNCNDSMDDDYNSLDDRDVFDEYEMQDYHLWEQSFDEHAP